MSFHFPTKNSQILLDFRPNSGEPSLKDECCAENPTSKQELTKDIKKVFYGITTNMLEKVFHNLCKKIDFCAQLNGSHFENICD